jgi:FkbM family methyltransferase
MTRNSRPFSTKIIDRIPQAVCLRSGLTIQLRNRHHVGDFWHIFTSAEYMSLVPELCQLRFDNFHLIDLGGGISLFTLLIEHLSRINILQWHNRRYTIVEASKQNYKMIKQNLSLNIPSSSFELVHGAAGKKTGTTKLSYSLGSPWGSTILATDSKDFHEAINYVDLTDQMSRPSTFVKMDIEGAEYLFISEYASSLKQITGLIIEWHTEKGSMEEAEQTLFDSGLRKIKRSWENGSRIVDLYLR